MLLTTAQAIVRYLIAQRTVVDCVFVAVAQRTYTESQAALEATRSAVRNRRLNRDRSARPTS